MAVLAFTGITGLVIGYFYGDEVKQYVVQEINKQLDTEVSVKNIDFSVLKKFPYASLEFSDVIAKEAVIRIGPKDTLFYAGKIFLQFNIVDIFKKKYHIKKIEINNAYAMPVIDEKGNDNYHFWKASEDDTSGNAFSFALERVLLKNIKVVYSNEASGQNISFDINKTVLNGNFSNDKYDMSFNSDLFVNHLLFEKINYMKEQNIKLDMVLTVNNKNNSYSISKGIMVVSQLKFDVLGKVFSVDDGTGLDLAINGKDMDIPAIFSLLPEKYKSIAKDYSSNGVFYFESTLTGEITPHTNPSFNAEFGITNGEVFQKSASIKLRNVNLKGRYGTGKQNRMETNFIEVNEFTATLGKGKLSGNFGIENFSSPKIHLSTVSEIDLAELQDFIQLDTIQAVRGNLKIDATFWGNIKDPKNYTIEDFKRSRTSGQMNFSDMKFAIKGNALDYNNINGQFLFDNNDIIINNLIGNISSSNFELKGFFRNIISYFFIEEQKLTVDATLRSANINLDELLSANFSPGSDSTYNLRFSKNAGFYLTVDIDKLTFRKFEGKNINGKIILKDEKFLANPVSLQAMDGEVTAAGIIDGSDGATFLITCDATVKNIDIQKLFYQFENFGQNIMEDKHIKGVAFANIGFVSVMNSNLQIDPDKIYTHASLSIEKGELINFEPMKELSSFIKVSELEHIKFSSLKNEIEIRNQEIYIPKMEVNSNALNISISGSHTFNNEIDYRFKVLLSDLLAQKARKAKKENEEFGFMVGVRGNTLVNVPLHAVAKGPRLVPLDDPLIKSARAVGTCFGD